MIYQVLYQKWRPKMFRDIVGQEHIVSVIKNSFVLNKLHHSYILFGSRGVGKTTIARLFAKILNCKFKTNIDMCGNCVTCLEIEKGCFLDVIEIDAASRTKIEDTREFLDDVYYSPNIGEFKVYLIDEVHMLSRNSLNALLKVLEEPPKHVKFFLITTEQKKLPDTILSRCIQFHLHLLSHSQIFNHLIHIFKKENIEYECSAVDTITNFAKGSIRDALSLSEHAIILGKNKISYEVVKNMLGIIDIDHPLFLLEKLVDSDIHGIMSRIDECDKLDVNWDVLLSEMLGLLRKIAIIQIETSDKNNTVNELMSISSRLHLLSKCLISSDIQLYYQIFLLGKKELPYTPSYRIGFEMIMIRASIIKNKDVDKYVDVANLITNQGAFHFKMF